MSLPPFLGALKAEFGVNLGKGHLERSLKNSFYRGQFWWEDKLYSGTHVPLVSVEMFDQVQAVFRSHNKPKYRRHEFPYRGLLTCAYDNCLVTAEIKKARYTYYRCTGYRGKCGLPYFREEELGDRLGQILKNIHIPDNILEQLQSSLLNDKGREETIRKQQGERLTTRLNCSIRCKLPSNISRQSRSKAPSKVCFPRSIWLQTSSARNMKSATPSSAPSFKRSPKG